MFYNESYCWASHCRIWK